MCIHVNPHMYVDWTIQLRFDSVRFGGVLRRVDENGSVWSRQGVIPHFVTQYALADDVYLRESPIKVKQTEMIRLQYVNVENIKLNQDDLVVMHTD